MALDKFRELFTGSLVVNCEAGARVFKTYPLICGDDAVPPVFSTVGLRCAVRILLIRSTYLRFVHVTEAV